MPSLDSRKQQALKLIKSRLPAQLMAFGTALGAIAIMGGAQLPPELQVIALSLGGNILATLIDRIASGENVPDDELKELVEAAVQQSGIKEQVAKPEFYQALRQLVQHLDKESEELRDLILSVLNNTSTREQVDTVITLQERSLAILEENAADKSSLLNERLRFSRARCIERWLAVGLSRSEAITLADDDSLGRPSIEFFPTDDNPLTMLIGEVGMGKSLIAERVYQDAVRNALKDIEAPLPLYVGSFENEELWNLLEAESQKSQISLTNGALIVIDGLDEKGMDRANELLRQARIATNTWAHVRVIITSRFIPVFAQNERVVDVPYLTEAESSELIQRIMGRQYNETMLHSHSRSITEALKRPLFAILFAVFMREKYGHPHSTGELISNMVNMTLSRFRTRIVGADNILQRLGVMVMDSATGFVPSNELVDSQEITNLVDTGLVVQRSHLVGFALPILAEWFAAQSLRGGFPAAESFKLDNERLQKWFYALVIFLGEFSHHDISQVFSTIAEANPIYATQLIKEAFFYSDEGTISLPSLEECNKRFMDTMQTWVKGIGNLANLIAPVHADGTLVTAQLGISEDRFFSSWDYESTVSPLLNRMEIRRSGRPKSQSGWMWQWTLDDLTHNLTNLFKKRALPISCEAQRSEAIWKAALVITDNQYYAKGKGINLNEFETQLSYVEGILTTYETYTVIRGGKEFKFSRPIVKSLREAVSKAMQNDSTLLLSPWPMPDITHPYFNGRVRYDYSEEQAQRRAKAVLEGALAIYESFVDSWFPNFKARLRIASTLPAILTANLYTLEGTWWSSSLSYYLDPLPKGTQSSALVHLRHGSILDDEWEPIYERLKYLRPNSAHWIGSTLSTGRTDIFRDIPATEMAYRWLWNELHSAGWLDSIYTSKFD